MKVLACQSTFELTTYSRLLSVNYVAPPGFEPATYRSRNRQINHSAIVPCILIATVSDRVFSIVAAEQ